MNPNERNTPSGKMSFKDIQENIVIDWEIKYRQDKKASKWLLIRMVNLAIFV